MPSFFWAILHMMAWDVGCDAFRQKRVIKNLRFAKYFHGLPEYFHDVQHQHQRQTINCLYIHYVQTHIASIQPISAFEINCHNYSCWSCLSVNLSSSFSQFFSNKLWDKVHGRIYDKRYRLANLWRWPYVHRSQDVWRGPLVRRSHRPDQTHWGHLGT